MKKKLNSKERRKIKREEEREKKKVEQVLKNAYSRPLPFQWIPKFNLCARTAMTDWYWKKLSKTLREKANYTCAYCGEQHPEPWGTALHEEWEYEFEKIDGKWKGIFKLKDLKCVCKKCHNVCHPGAAAHFENKEIEDIIKRYCEINNVNEDEAYEEFIMTKARRDVLAKNISEWKLEDDILNKIKDKYGITCYSKNIQF